MACEKLGNILLTFTIATVQGKSFIICKQTDSVLLDCGIDNPVFFLHTFSGIGSFSSLNGTCILGYLFLDIIEFFFPL